MPTVKLKEGDTFEGAMRKFKRVVDKTRILQELRGREFHVTGSVKKQRQRSAAKKRLAKKLAREKFNLKDATRSNSHQVNRNYGKKKFFNKRPPATEHRIIN